MAEMKRPIGDQIAEVKREIALRKSVYPGFVTRGKFSQAEADEHLARMEATLETLQRVERKITEGRASA